jgi:site-specific DNA-methyltransferase (adenine-specific)
MPMSIDLIHGNAFDILRGERGIADVLITDPPYSEVVHDTMTKKGTLTNGTLGKVDPGFVALNSFDFVPGFCSSVKRWALFFCALEDLGSYRQANAGEFIRSGIYAKGKAMPQITGDRPGNRCEGLAIFHPKGKKRWNGGGTAALWIGHPPNRKETLHPTAKPLLLCMRLVDLFTEPGETVLDPFAGVATIGLACAALGRNYIGIELQAEHYENGRTRLAHFNADDARKRYSAYVARYVGPGSSMIDEMARAEGVAEDAA